MAAANVSISDAFDGGNIKLLEITLPPVAAEDDDEEVDAASAPAVVVVRLAIKPDVFTELEDVRHMQYFAFRSTVSSPAAGGGGGLRVRYVIENADSVSYPVAWKGTTVCYNSSLRPDDDDGWRRNVGTEYHDGRLSWEHLHDGDAGGSVYFSYFPPFGYGRHLDLVDKCAERARILLSASGAGAGAGEGGEGTRARVYSLGQTLQGRDIDVVEVGTGPLQCWIIHRQHPGETQAEFYAEGLLGRLLGLDDDAEAWANDETVREVLREFTFHVVPCMCLDGAVLGHLRTNSVGANLNREWAPKENAPGGIGTYDAPTPHRSPEVYHVLRRMDETGVDAFLDIHGDEELPYNFASGAEHTPRWGPRLQNLHGAFVAAYCRSNPDMQRHIGYPPPASPEEVLPYLNVATNQVASRFDCLSITLEMPYKDCVTAPDPERGWCPGRCRKLGASVLEALAYVRPHLRSLSPDFSPDEQYVEPHDDFVSHEWENEGFKPLRRMYSDHYSNIKKAKAVGEGSDKFQ